MDVKFVICALPLLMLKSPHGGGMADTPQDVSLVNTVRKIEKIEKFSLDHNIGNRRASTIPTKKEVCVLKD